MAINQDDAISREIWRMIAEIPRVPAIGSLVTYFPQGHFDNCAPFKNVGQLEGMHVAVRYQCRLQLVERLWNGGNEPCLRLRLGPNEEVGNQEPNPEIPIFLLTRKVLTPSDTVAEKGLTIPRRDALRIFPRMANGQNHRELVVRDIGAGADHHIRYTTSGGDDGLHRLTSGWTTGLRRTKNLQPGDSALFAKVFEDHDDHVRFACKRFVPGVPRGNPNQVTACITCAQLGDEFDVFYYPRYGPMFVVPEDEMHVGEGWIFQAGSHVQTRYQITVRDWLIPEYARGVITQIQVPQHGLWLGSPWKSLQVEWDMPVPSPRPMSPWELVPIP